MALFFEAKPCHQAKMMANCPLHSTGEHKGDQESKDCCDDKTTYVKSEIDQLVSTSEVEANFTPVLLNVLLVALRIEFPTIDSQSLHYLNYKPPLIVWDLPVSLQTFLC